MALSRDGLPEPSKARESEMMSTGLSDPGSESDGQRHESIRLREDT